MDWYNRYQLPAMLSWRGGTKRLRNIDTYIGISTALHPTKLQSLLTNCTLRTRCSNVFRIIYSQTTGLLIPKVREESELLHRRIFTIFYRYVLSQKQFRKLFMFLSSCSCTRKYSVGYTIWQTRSTRSSRTKCCQRPSTLFPAETFDIRKLLLTLSLA